MTAPNIWYGRNANVVIGTAITVATTSTLWAQATAASGYNITNLCKDLKITPGESGVDALNVFGTQLLEEKRPALVTADFTIVFTNIDSFGSTNTWTSVTTPPAGYTRFTGLDSTGNKTKRCIGFSLVQTGTNGQGTVNALMNNAIISNQGDLSIAADGSAEQTLSAVCQLTDFSVEDNIV
jgi:hypothetical protein